MTLILLIAATVAALTADGNVDQRSSLSLIFCQGGGESRG